MKILVADDEPFALESLKDILRAVVPDAEIVGFLKSSQVIEYMRDNCCDIVFLDIEMRGKSGLDIARELKILQPKVNIIFVTGYLDYTMEAFTLHASGYLLKPATIEKVKNELDNLRNPILLETKQVKIQTFGKFEVFVNGEPLLFTRNKPKELLAYLVDRKGAGISSSNIANVLWENKEYNRSLRNQVQTVIVQLKEVLKSAGIEDILIKKWNNLAIDVGKVNCDYYRFIEGDKACTNQFTGEYMSDYSWAEVTTGYLISNRG